MTKKLNLIVALFLIISLSLFGCSKSNDNNKTNKEDILNQLNKVYSEKKYPESVSKYAEFISAGGDVKEFGKLDELMMNFIKEKFAKDKSWTTIADMNKDGYAFGDLDNDKIPEIYIIPYNSKGEKKSPVKVYLYSKDKYHDSSDSVGPSNTAFPGELVVGKINDGTYGLIDNSEVSKDSNIDVYIMNKGKLERLINSTVSGLKKYAQDIDGDGILEIPQLNDDKKLTWYKFDKDLKPIAVKEEKINTSDNSQVATKQNKDTENNIASNDTKKPVDNTAIVKSLKDDEILSKLIVGRNFEISRLMGLGDSNQTITIDSLSYAVIKDQNTNVENEIKSFNQYFSKAFVNNHVRNFFKESDGKKYVLFGQGLSNGETFTKVISSDQGSNKINARVEYVDGDVSDVCNVELVYEDNAWKINDGTLLIK
ncbi:IseA DL-endopeptidase inhibitor family protein [Clostridium folliculivorans]|uniref:Lipoprotein n=1 Tax=Clostridium folliculivorans TaxID=2886038 RepID=A0A9W5XZK6_9CLOT|nr:IseA DL-endopeptidase inhibitor family protein [Clostridium folliculivorans]GKU23801.1 hypothetical protein CFOLD11_06270 [Clostridium folliculivorans]GKU29917.1 hypothetical protein CFB3_20240 [Clostridium folliculivorans]